MLRILNSSLRIGFGIASIQRAVLEALSGLPNGAPLLQQVEYEVFGMKIDVGTSEAQLNMPMKAMLAKAAKDNEDVSKFMQSKGKN